MDQIDEIQETTALLPQDEAVVALKSDDASLFDVIWLSISYRKLHIAYFVTIIAVGAAVLHAPHGKVVPMGWLDAVFMATSAASMCGISVVPMENLGPLQQVVLWSLMLFGSAIWTSLWPVWLRLHYFNRTLKFVETHFDEIESRVTPFGSRSDLPRGDLSRGDLSRGDLSRGDLSRAQLVPSRVSRLANLKRAMAPAGWPFNYNTFIDVPKDEITREYVNATMKLPHRLRGTLHPTLYRRASLDSINSSYSNNSVNSSDSPDLQIPALHAPARDNHQRITLQSFAHVLQTKAMHALPERNALILLSALIPAYILACLSIATAIMAGWVWRNPDIHDAIRKSGTSPVNPWWYLFFLATSAFVNCGFNIVSVGVTLFRLKSGPVLFVLMGLIVAGNTLSPVFLRAIVRCLRWLEDKRLGRREGFYRQASAPGSLSTAAPKSTSRFLDACDYLLEHPRRVYTLMFPSSATWWILFINVSLTMVGYLLYLTLEWNRYTLIGLANRGSAFFVDGLFSEVNTRSSGMNIFDLYNFHPSVCLWFVVAMYIQIYPIALARRRTNVYVERDVLSETHNPAPKQSYIVNQLRSQVFSEAGFVFLCVFLVITAEASQLDQHETVFSLIFEVVSAFGTCGLSMGHPNAPMSLSYRFKDVTKCVLILTMFVGRHRGLPNAVDKSINLPGLAEVEEAGGLFLAMASKDAQPNVL